jgi:A/G-specific adenine glycosylase
MKRCIFDLNKVSMAQRNLGLEEISSFQDFIWNFYSTNKRDFAWRNNENPYHVVVSELMLQQTQTHRVEPKFELFIGEFPDFETLAQASLRNVLSLWQGLGYNRRGKYLQQIAQAVVLEHGGRLPADTELLRALPGIGPYTAGSICAFAFNKPTVFIETNIRAVYLHTFYKDVQKVPDAELLPLIAATLDPVNPREWYYALMDYGVELKKSGKNPNVRSKHHAVQSKFEGSDRQIRGRIIALLTSHEQLSLSEIIERVDGNQRDRIERIVGQLCSDEMIKNEQGRYFI